LHKVAITQHITQKNKLNNDTINDKVQVPRILKHEYSQFQFHSCPVVFPEGTNIQNDLLIKLGQLDYFPADHKNSEQLL